MGSAQAPLTPSDCPDAPHGSTQRPCNLWSARACSCSVGKPNLEDKLTAQLPASLLPQLASLSFHGAKEQSEKKEEDEMTKHVLKFSPRTKRRCLSRLLLPNPRRCLHWPTVMRAAQHVPGRQRCHSPVCPLNGILQRVTTGKGRRR